MQKIHIPLIKPVTNCIKNRWIRKLQLSCKKINNNIKKFKALEGNIFSLELQGLALTSSSSSLVKSLRIQPMRGPVQGGGGGTQEPT